MRLRTALFALAALLAAVVFVSLGLWQLRRLRERQAINATLAARMKEAPVAVGAASGSPVAQRFVRARVSGMPAYDQEVVLGQRSREGSPGVWLVTPLATVSSDSLTVVVRGWVYSPDGTTVDLARWREGDSLTVEGWLDTLATGGSSDSIAGRVGVLRRLDQQRLASRFGRPVRRMYLMATRGDAAQRADVPARFTLPEMDEGPHRSYAFQWFSFAAIALIGGGVIAVNDRRARRGGAERIPAPRTLA
ncbi:MAG TPA: SURF1 family protein [Gemmatimonadaceae bacterium]|nr:SURF1 family protein [Gemmatimonadaceae bacterium]